MPTNVILPALGIAQDTGKIIEWLKAEGDAVTEGDALVTLRSNWRCFCLPRRCVLLMMGYKVLVSKQSLRE